MFIKREWKPGFFLQHKKGANYKQKYIILLSLFVLGFAFSLSITGCGPPEAEGENPIEPVVSGQEGSEGDLQLMGQFAVMNPEMEIYTLSLSERGREILFSSDTRSVKMLDNRGSLEWEFACEGNPISGALSSEGDYISIGTDMGKLYFLDNEGEELWEEKLQGKIKGLAMSYSGDYLSVSVEEQEEGEDPPDKNANKVYFFDRWGAELWHIDTEPLRDMGILEEEYMYTLEGTGDEENEDNILKAYREGTALWQKEVNISSFSPGGDYLAAYKDGTLSFYQVKEGVPPNLLWEEEIEVGVDWLDVTENGEQVVAYSDFSGSGDNLFMFSEEGEKLWEKRIPSGSLIDISRSGDKIVASSWREYSDDVSKLLVLDSQGSTLQEVELASRIEKLSLSQEGNILALAGNEGDIFILGIPDMRFIRGGFVNVRDSEEQEKIDYRPVSFEPPDDKMYITLYFYDDQGIHLLPVNRSVEETTAPLQAAADELVKGPSRLSGLSRTIPKDIDIDVKIEEETAVIDLPAEVNRFSGSSQVVGIIDSLILTASQFTSVEEISLLVDGEAPSHFGTEGLLVDKNFSPRRPGQHGNLIYVPYRSNNQLYIFPREDIKLGKEIKTSEDMVMAVISEFRDILPLAPGLKEIDITGDKIKINFEQEFKKLFPKEPDQETLVYGQLFLDSLLLTLTENLGPDEVVIYAGEEAFEPPAKYEFKNELERPYYINPE